MYCVAFQILYKLKPTISHMTCNLQGKTWCHMDGLNSHEKQWLYVTQTIQGRRKPPCEVTAA